jgi:hypothetical protein
VNLRTGLIAASVLTAALSAHAIPFDNTSGGPAVATVGTGGDYATFAQANNAFNAVVGGINRPWTLEVLDDLVEPNFTGLANTFGSGGSLTIKPAANANPKITFNTTATQAGTAFFGHFIIGSLAFDVVNGPNTAVSTTNTIASSGKYIIDGANTTTGTTRNLTFVYGETTASASAANNIIRIVGDTDGVVIKNTNFVFNDTAGSHAAIGLGGGLVGGNPAIPDGTVIENNSFIIGQGATTGANAFGIQTTIGASGTVPAGTAIQGITIRNNDITTKQRGMFLQGVGNATVERNRITLANTNNATANNCIFHFNSNGTAGYTQVYDSNVINAESAISTAGANGAFAILVDSGTAGIGGNYIITNNVIKGNFLTNPTPVDAIARGISFGQAASTYLIEHNSVSIPASSASGVTSARVAGIIAPSALTGSGSAVVRNNIVRMGDPDGLSAALSINATTTGLTFEGNLLSATGGRIGRVTATSTNYATLADWQTLGYDAPASGSQSVDPFSTGPAWDVNLKFAGRPISGISGVTSSTITLDIDGEARPSTDAIPGADEPGPLQAGASNWKSYE